MPRIADALDRESRSVDLEPGDFERLLSRRERKQRNRQIRAGVVGVIVALAAAAFLVRAIHLEVTPANPNPPKQIGAGEVLFGGTARDPNTGAVRSVVDSAALPARSRIITASAWSYDHEWVAFRASSGGSFGGSIWIADTASGAPRRIGPDGRWTPWVWSPTADQVAIVRGRDAILVDAATGHETDLGQTAGLTHLDGYAVRAMTWSPDGTQIAYSGGPGGGSVYLIDVASGEHSVLVRRPAGEAGWVGDIDWSPDAAHLAITYERGSGGSLYLANADGSGVHLVDRNVAGGPWPDWQPGESVSTQWSPDGTRLAYSTFTERNRKETQLWTVSPDLSTRTLITTPGGAAVWSPDGSQIAVANESGVGAGSQTGFLTRYFFVVNADGTGDRTDMDQLMYRSWDGGWYFCFCYG
jgi:Tol biopolymer transport system component